MPPRPNDLCIGVSQALRPHSHSSSLYGSVASPVPCPQTAKIAILSLDRKLCPSFRSAGDAQCGGRTWGRCVSHDMISCSGDMLWAPEPAGHVPGSRFSNASFQGLWRVCRPRHRLGENRAIAPSRRCPIQTLVSWPSRLPRSKTFTRATRLPMTALGHNLGSREERARRGRCVNVNNSWVTLATTTTTALYPTYN